MARTPAAGEKPVAWVGSAKRDFLAFPGSVKDEMGDALGVAQFGGKHPKVKPWTGQGAGVFEIVDDDDGNAYRAVYVVRFREVIYVLHAVQKKSRKGIKTARGDVELVARRLKLALQDHEVRFGQTK